VPSDARLTVLSEVMAVASLPGLSMACVEKAKIVWRHSAGRTNVQTTDAVHDDTLFPAASMSKPVFAYVVLQLVEEQVLELDRPIAQYHRPGYMPDDLLIDRITARHILCHSSGLPNWGDPDNPETLKPAFDPGSAFRYSGEGFFWLQLVVEHLTSSNLETVIRSRLFDPAGLVRSTYVMDAIHEPWTVYGHKHGRLEQDGRRAKLPKLMQTAAAWGRPLNVWSQADFVRAVADMDPSTPKPPQRSLYVNAAASLLTTAAEYAQLTTLLMERRTRDSWELALQSRLAMLAPQITTAGDPSYAWGLGWSLERQMRATLFAHGGSNDNMFESFCVGDPIRGKAIVILTNGDSGPGVYQQLIRSATGYELLAFLANLNPPVGVKST
jgi:CubicO group peptidase (beta-lactamase class C family)